VNKIGVATTWLSLCYAGSEKCCYRTWDLIKTWLLPALLPKVWLPKLV